MKYSLCQKVTIIDLSGEPLTEVLFEHGILETPPPILGGTVVSYQLGLHEFEVVYDRREGQISRSKIIDMEINLLDPAEAAVKVYLEPVQLIIGQHDVGQI